MLAHIANNGPVPLSPALGGAAQFNNIGPVPLSLSLTISDLSRFRFLSRFRPRFRPPNGPVWVIHSLDQAKAVYARPHAELAQVEAKKLTGDRKRIQAIRNRKWAASQGLLSRQFGLSPQALEAILACGRTNQWPIVKVGLREEQMNPLRSPIAVLIDPA